MKIRFLMNRIHLKKGVPLDVTLPSIYKVPIDALNSKKANKNYTKEGCRICPTTMFDLGMQQPWQNPRKIDRDWYVNKSNQASIECSRARDKFYTVRYLYDSGKKS